MLRRRVVVGKENEGLPDSASPADQSISREPPDFSLRYQNFTKLDKAPIDPQPSHKPVLTAHMQCDAHPRSLSSDWHL
jgi:hypothetical protein